jgi:DNA polymerase-3 subunit alpha
VPRLAKDEELQMEKELIGVYVSGHPLQAFGPKLNFYSTHMLATAEEIADGTTVVVGGLLTATRKAMTKKGLPMMSGMVEDLTGSIEVVFFPEAYEKNWQLLNNDAKLLVTGKVSNKEDELKILASGVKPLAHLSLLHLTLPQDIEGGAVLGLRNVISKHKGDVPLIIHFPHLPEVVLAGEQFRVDPNDTLLFELRKLLGVGSVRLEDPAPAMADTGLAMTS